jgi:hypothetical protein
VDLFIIFGFRIFLIRFFLEYFLVLGLKFISWLLCIFEYLGEQLFMYLYGK